MMSFEKDYYENEIFWEGNALQDNFSMQRINTTIRMLPYDVKSLVDIGCGNGVFLQKLNDTRPGLDLLGVDRSSTALKYVSIKKINASIDALPIDNESFDCVSCLEVLEHLPIPTYKKALQHITRIARKYILISVPFDENLREYYTKCPSCSSIFNRNLHVRSFDVNDLESLLLPYGFQCLGTSTTGTLQNLYFQEWIDKYVFPENYQKWNSPVCPLCGFKQSEKNKINSPILNRFKYAFYNRIVPIWPKKNKDYWIVALYRRNDKQHTSTD